jgi:carbon-monoxide dehydrogenase small subunit
VTRVALTINGAAVTAEVAPRMHLADFLREERGLTGTHLGCEHGICGACTLLIDGAPARSCIAFTVACDGADISSIEGLEHDPTIVRLRAAFTEEHALQCGYCTPGMLVTARDIVHRLPDADEACIRLELAGNLCRCTGYAGIVRAIRRVLVEGVAVELAAVAPLPLLPVTEPPSVATAMPRRVPLGTGFTETVRFAAPLETIWGAVRDAALIASCVPGARLTEIAGDRLTGELRAALGPIEARFTGAAVIAFDDAARRVTLTGEGRDTRTGTRVSGGLTASLRADNGGTEADLAFDYTLRGPLAQFARPSVARAFAAEIVGVTTRNLEARLHGAAEPGAPGLSLGRLLWRMILRAVRSTFGRGAKRRG